MMSTLLIRDDRIGWKEEELIVTCMYYLFKTVVNIECLMLQKDVI